MPLTRVNLHPPITIGPSNTSYHLKPPLAKSHQERRSEFRGACRGVRADSGMCEVHTQIVLALLDFWEPQKTKSFRERPKCPSDHPGALQRGPKECPEPTRDAWRRSGPPPSSLELYHSQAPRMNQSARASLISSSSLRARDICIFWNGAHVTTKQGLEVPSTMAR